MKTSPRYECICRLWRWCRASFRLRLMKCLADRILNYISIIMSMSMAWNQTKWSHIFIIFPAANYLRPRRSLPTHFVQGEVPGFILKVTFGFIHVISDYNFIIERYRRLYAWFSGELLTINLCMMSSDAMTIIFLHSLMTYSLQCKNSRTVLILPSSHRISGRLIRRIVELRETCMAFRQASSKIILPHLRFHRISSRFSR